MLTLLHGDNQASSRLFLDRFRNRENIEIKDAKNFSKEVITLLLEPTLMNEDRTLILENPKIEHLTSLKDEPSVSLIVWFGKKLERIILKSPPWKVQEFSLIESKSIYTFIDSFVYKDMASTLQKIELLKKENISFDILIGALSRQILCFINYKELETANLNYFQKKLFVSADKKWTLKELKNVLKRLIRTEYIIKTGRIEPNMALFQLLTKTLA